MAFRPRDPRVIIPGLVLGCWLTLAAHATDGSPVFAIPGHLGVPVIINGIDATGAVVYGDWGLSRPGHGYVFIEGGLPGPRGPVLPRYFPATGKPPNYGRDEIPPPPGRPSPPADFHRSWSAGSGDLPATEYPPYDPPPVILAPRHRHQGAPPPQPPAIDRR